MIKRVLAVAVFVFSMFLGTQLSWALFGHGRLIQDISGGVATVAHPISISPTNGTILDNVAAGTTIATLTVGMSDGSTFNGSITATDGTGLVCSTSPCTVANPLVTARAATSTDDGSHNITLVATANGQKFTATFTLNVNPVSGTVSCAYGPTYNGSVPSPASAAGFTTCAANYDFTQTAAFNDTAGNHTWSTLSTWLSCTSSGASTTLWYAVNMPCGDITVGTDSGKQVLITTLTPTDYDNNLPSAEISTTCGDNCATGTTFPNAIYIEWELRYDTNSYNNIPLDNVPMHTISAGLWDLFSVGVSPYNFNTAFGGPTTGIYELDWGEAYHFPSNSTQAPTMAIWSMNCGSRCFGLDANIPQNYGANDATVYHVFAARFTQDTSGNTGTCIYLDPTPSNSGKVGCGTVNQPEVINSQIINELDQLIWTGAIRTILNDCGGGSSSCRPSVNLISYLRRITVWSCSSWTSGGCTGTVLTN